MKYRTIVVDPPWSYPDGFTKQSISNGKPLGRERRYWLSYGSMTVDEIAALPVAQLADANARLFLWTTNRYLPDAFAVMGTWGFKYRQVLVWHKRDGNMGGSVAPCSAEFLLVGVRGTPEVLAKWSTAVISTVAPKQHSKKPDVFLDLVEQVSPGPYAELFARRARFGWDYPIGDQALGGVAA